MDIPISFKEDLDLTLLGLHSGSFDFKSTTLQSDKYICVRDVTSTSNSVVIIDLSNKNNVIRKNMSADNAIMHPSELVISLRAKGMTLQVFNLSTKQRLKSHNMHESVLFWKWLNNKYLGLVTFNSLYTWNIFDGTNDGPVKLCDKHHDLNNCQIINFISDPSFQWFSVVGVTKENDFIAGHIQLYSSVKKVSHSIDGHSCNFSFFKFNNSSQPIKVFCVAKKNFLGQGNLHIIEIDHKEGNSTLHKKSIEIFFPHDAIHDFPIGCETLEKYGLIFVLTKMGFIHLFDIESCTNLFINRITADPVFLTQKKTDSPGLLIINKSGQVLSIEISKDKFIPYLLEKFSNVNLALSLVAHGDFVGGEEIFNNHFEKLLNSGDYMKASSIAACCKNLRTFETINKLKAIGSQNGKSSPLLHYFSTLLDKGTLNKEETIELVKLVLQQDRVDLFEKWLIEDKLTYSSELGDIIKLYNRPELALTVYIKVKLHSKAIICLAELDKFDKIRLYFKKIKFTECYVTLIKDLIDIHPEKTSDFASFLLEENLINDHIEEISDLFFNKKLIQHGTAFLLDALKNDLKSEGHLQTKLLEINLLNVPQVAEAILGNSMFTQYDKYKIAKLCEKAGLHQKSLEHYDELKDIKRILINDNQIPIDWLVKYLSKLNSNQLVICLKELLNNNSKSNLQLVIQIAIKYSNLIGPNVLISIFDEFKCVEGLFFYLSSIVITTQNPEVVFRYIQVTIKMNQYNDLEKILKENNIYNGEKVKNYLKEVKLDNQLPLIIVCDRYNFVNDLILYLYRNQNFDSIQLYIKSINSSNTPIVIGCLLDVDCDESLIKKLLFSVLGLVSVKSLVDEFEKRNRLKILLPFLEKSLELGKDDKEIYNTLAKIYIDSNNSPEKYLKENDFYDTNVIGVYCKKRDPYLAYLCFSKGKNDDELIEITNENKMYKYQARYLLNRSNIDLWNKVLSKKNMHRKNLIDQVIANGAMDLVDPEPISIVVKSFMDNVSNEDLMELLEKIIIENTPFSNNSSLQCLLILTAIKADPSRVLGYIDNLDKYDPDEISQLFIDNEFYEEAFEVYNKFGKRVEAMKVMVNHIKSIDRGELYAVKYDSPKLWYILANAQLEMNYISDAIDSYIKSENPENYLKVIEMSNKSNNLYDLISFLKMARKTLTEPIVDAALIKSYASLNKLDEIEKFVTTSNVCDLELIGDELFEDKNYKAAMILYTNISKYSKLARTLVYLHDYQGAVDCAKKASNTNVWKEANIACIHNKEFKLAQVCGLNLIVDAEELPDLVKIYEENGYFDELIFLFESALTSERTHMSLFTELAILYCKYDQSKLTDYLKLYFSRLNFPKVINVCEEAHLYTELIFLYTHYEEWDNAALTMINHSESTFDHSHFKEIILKAKNTEIYYKAILFYLNENPTYLLELLHLLTPKIDLTRTVRLFIKLNNVYLIKPFFESCLYKNNTLLNSTYCDLLISEQNYTSLEAFINNDSIDKYNKLYLAEKIENHKLIFFRKLSAKLYAKEKKFSNAIAILKKDCLWIDLIKTVSLSKSTKFSHQVLDFFIESEIFECFLALLYVCYDYISYDYVLEKAWSHNLTDLIKPYEISIAYENQKKIDEVYNDLINRRENKDNTKNDALMIKSDMINTSITDLKIQPTGAGFGNDN